VSGHHPSTTYLVVAGNLMACGGWMNCVVYSLTRRVFQNRKTKGDQDTPRTRSGDKKGSSDGTVTEMSLLGSAKSHLYRERQSTVDSTENIIAMGKNVNYTGHSELNEGVTMERTWEVRTEEVKPKPAIPESYRLGHRVSVSF
jgi:hypothetical protein